MAVKVKVILEKILRLELSGRWEGPDSGGYTEYKGDKFSKKYLISGYFDQRREDSFAGNVLVSRIFDLDGASVSIGELMKLKTITQDSDIKYSVSQEELTLSKDAKNDEEFEDSFNVLDRTLDNFLPNYDPNSAF